MSGKRDELTLVCEQLSKENSFQSLKKLIYLKDCKIFKGLEVLYRLNFIALKYSIAMENCNYDYLHRS